MESSKVSVGRRTFSLSEKACLQKLIIRYKLDQNNDKYGTREINDRRRAWARLTQEFNSFGTNSNRTLAQLKKCWDNIKRRKKQTLEKREYLKSRGPYTAFASQKHSLDLDPLMGIKSEDIPWSSDSDDDVVKEFLAAENNDLVDTEVPLRTPPHHEAAQPPPDISVSVNGTTQALENDIRIREREEELHKLRISERMWLLRTLKEQHRTAQIERETAELEREKAQFNRDKAQLEREKAHLDLIRAKREETDVV